jgi:hypothetical protein
MQLDWEPIRPFNHLDRIRVPGGWLYRTVHKTVAGENGVGSSAVALCFVPEPGPVIPIVKVQDPDGM